MSFPSLILPTEEKFISILQFHDAQVSNLGGMGVRAENVHPQQIRTHHD
jgi:hypothetical protein